MAATTIEWTEATWNPVTGCTKVSPGCQHCYAERMARRLQAMGQPHYARGFEVACHEDALLLPLRWKKPRRIFVNSMGDVFHSRVPEEFVRDVFEVMARADQHCFQLLTKRAARLAELARRLPWPSNVWVGVSVETADYLGRLDHLREVPAAVRFVSFEPLLGPVGEVDLSGIDWVIVGGESGPFARPMAGSWAADLRDQCLAAGVAFFFKQWGGTRKKQAGRLLEGRLWDEAPVEALAR
jgi:protein gp37